ncbi:MAG: hypothetical protein HRU00_11675 [Myxococcales bacterium]|nr:hypothetical protein [Myxococcales bacterium]
MREPIVMIKVSDVAFGLATTERAGDLLYSRGTDPEPFVHVTPPRPCSALAQVPFSRTLVTGT